MIQVYHGQHVAFDAINLTERLNNSCIKAERTHKIDPSSTDLHIIYQASGLTKLPKNYIIQQTEPYCSHWFNDEYRRTLSRARCVWDYSTDNMNHYTANSVFVPPQVYPQKSEFKHIDHLFYGWIEGSPRRQKTLENLQRSMDIMIVTNLLGKSMWDLLSRTVSVFNIHYHDNSPLELYRVQESLSFGCRVFTEGMHENLVGDYQDDKYLISGLNAANL